MKIIQEHDSRFNLLDLIFEKYNFESISIRYDDGYLDYFIPPELVLVNSELGDSAVNDLLTYNDGDNLVYPNKLSYFLNECCNLTVQELFDLCVLHINDTEDRPKCLECDKSIIFSGEFQRGYARHHWIKEASHRLFCSNSCKSYYMHHHLDEYPHLIDTVTRLSEVGNDFYKQSKAAFVRSLNANVNGRSDFYVSKSDDGIKYGVSIDACYRVTKLWDTTEYVFKYFTSDVRIISLLEFLIKLELHSIDQDITSEYLTHSIISTFKKLFKKYYSYLKSKSVIELDNLIIDIKSNKLSMTDLISLTSTTIP